MLIFFTFKPYIQTYNLKNMLQPIKLNLIYKVLLLNLYKIKEVLEFIILLANNFQ